MFILIENQKVIGYETGETLSQAAIEQNLPYCECSDDVIKKYVQGFPGFHLKKESIEKYQNKQKLTVEDFSTERTYDIDDMKQNIKYKATIFTKDAIEFGCLYNGKRYTFKEEDQINYNDLLTLDLDKYPIKAAGEDDYTLVSKKEFNELHEKLIRTKVFWLNYRIQLGKYLDEEDTDYIKLRTFTFEKLPKKYKDAAKEAAGIDDVIL